MEETSFPLKEASMAKCEPAKQVNESSSYTAPLDAPRSSDGEPTPVLATSTPVQNSKGYGDAENPEGRIFRSTNYKVQANFYFRGDQAWSTLAIADTGAGVNCIRKDAIPSDLLSNRREGPGRCIAANGTPMATSGIIDVWTQIGGHISVA